MGLPAFIQTDLQSWLKSFKFSTSIRTRFGETDAFGHINNVSYFSYFELARIEYFENLHLYKLLDINNSSADSVKDNLIVTADLECHYLSQLYYGQIVDIFVKTSRIGNSSFDLHYAIVEKENGTVAAVGRGAIVYMNRKTNKGEPLPHVAKETMARYENIINYEKI